MRTRRRREVRSIRTPLRTGGWARVAVHCDFVAETMYAGGSSGSLRHSNPPPQVEQLFLEAEARAEVIFIFAAGAFDVAEFFFDFV